MVVVSRLAWLTPDGAPVGTKSIVLLVPDHFVYEAIVRSALLDLINPGSWEQRGDQAVSDAIDAMMSTVYMTISDWSEV